MADTKGMLVTVLRPAGGSSTNGGVSDARGTFILVGDGIPPVFEIREGEPYLILTKRGDWYHARPSEPKPGAGPMFGGNWIVTSDSRWPFPGPIAVHDRWEQ